LTFRGPCIVIYSYNKSQKDALFLNFILVKNSICFGQTYYPSPVVLILYSQQLVFVVLVMLSVCYHTVNINSMIYTKCYEYSIDPLNAELNPICHLLALLGAHHIFQISRKRVKTPDDIQ